MLSLLRERPTLPKPRYRWCKGLRRALALSLAPERTKNAAHLDSGATSAVSVARLLSQRCGRSAHLGAGHHMSTPSLLRPLENGCGRALRGRIFSLARAGCDVDKYLRDGYLRESLTATKKKSHAIDVSRDADWVVGSPRTAGDQGGAKMRNA